MSEPTELQELEKFFEIEELHRLIRQFLATFEIVFDNDWALTIACLKDPSQFNQKGQTFLSDNEQEIINNWHNRACLLHKYRELKKFMTDRDLYTDFASEAFMMQEEYLNDSYVTIDRSPNLLL